MKTIKINGVEIEITPEIKKQILEQLGEKSVAWKPEIGKDYWYMGDCGDVESDIYSNDVIDNFRYSIGNMYETKEEAEEALKTGWVAQLQARKRIDDYIAEKGYDTNVDWNDANTEKYYILYNYHYHTKKLFGVLTYSHKSSNLPHFVKSEDRDDVLKHCENDYKLLLGIE